jgi:hypothetical protein
MNLPLEGEERSFILPKFRIKKNPSLSGRGL